LKETKRLLAAAVRPPLGLCRVYADEGDRGRWRREDLSAAFVLVWRKQAEAMACLCGEDVAARLLGRR
jgi:hypothetical protein